MNCGIDIKKIFIGIYFLISVNVKAQVLTLDSILNSIEKTNPELKMYDNKVKTFDAYAEGAKSLDPPQFGTGFFMTPYNPMYWKPGDMSPSGMGSLMFTGQQMITNPQKLDANFEYMKSMSKVEGEMKNSMRNEMFSMAKMEYYECVILKKKLRILIESESLVNYLIKSTEIRYTYGMDKLNSYYKAQGMLGDIQSMKLMTELEIKQKMISLNTLMNRDKETVFDIDSVYSVKNYEVVLTDTSLIASSRSDYKLINQNIGFLKSKQLYEQSKRLPDFGIKYDHMLAFGTQPQQFSLMAMVSIPIAPWSSKMYKSSVRGLGFEIDALNNQRQALLNNINGTIQNLKAQMKSKKQQVELYEKTIIPAMKKNYETTRIAYEQNTEELFMALDAWQNLKMVQLGYIDQIMELLALQVEYEKQMEIR